MESLFFALISSLIKLANSKRLIYLDFYDIIYKNYTLGIQKMFLTQFFKNLKNKIFLSKDCTDKKQLTEKYILIFSLAIFAIFICFLIINAIYSAVNNLPFFISSSIFFQDTSDTFMDFFNVNSFVEDMNPYEIVDDKFGSSYPPLILLFAKFFHLISFAGTSAPRDVRESAGGIIALIIYFLIFFVLAFMLIKKALKKREISLSTTIIFYVALTLSMPMLYVIDRGNYLIYSLLFVAIFFTYKDSDKRYQKELSYLALAVAIAFKLYPVLFAVLLLTKKDFLGFIKTGVYSLLLFVLPFAVFKGGFKNVLYFFTNLQDFSKSMSVSKIFFQGYSASLNNSISLRSVLTVLYLAVTNKDYVYDTIPSYIETTGLILTLVLVLSAIILCFFIKQEWKKAYLITGAMIIFPNPNYCYVLVFLLIPIVMYMISDKHENPLVYIPLFIISVMPLPLGYLFDALTHGFRFGYAITNLVQFFAYASVMVVIMACFIKDLIKNKKKKALYE